MMKEAYAKGVVDALAELNVIKLSKDGGVTDEVIDFVKKSNFDVNTKDIGELKNFVNGIIKNSMTGDLSPNTEDNSPMEEEAKDQVDVKAAPDPFEGEGELGEEKEIEKLITE